MSLLSSRGVSSDSGRLSRRDRLRQQREVATNPNHSNHPSSAESFRRSVPGTQAHGNRERSVIPLDAARARTASARRAPVASSAPRTQKAAQPEFRTAPLPESSRPAQMPPDRSRYPGKKQSINQRRAFPMAAFIQGVRLVILGVGVWAIVGTVLSVWNPATRSEASQAALEDTQADWLYTQQLDSGAASRFSNLIAPGREMTGLATRLAPITSGLTELTPGVYLVDLDTGDYFSLNGEETFAAASMIKVPILVAFFEDVDAGKIRLDEMLSMQESDLASGSGEMQFHGVGTQYTALETAANMIIISDNTATNMLIRRLGGIEALNQRFREWGLQQTVLRNPLPDLEGTNTTSPKELSNLLARISEGDLISMKSRDRLLEIMQQTVNNSLLPASLGEGATIAHKTGDIGSLTGDVGLVDMPNGKRYAITVMVKRPHNDALAYELVVQIGAVAYDYLNASATPPTAPSFDGAADEASMSPTENEASTPEVPASAAPEGDRVR